MEQTPNKDNPADMSSQSKQSETPSTGKPSEQKVESKIVEKTNPELLKQLKTDNRVSVNLKTQNDKFEINISKYTDIENIANTIDQLITEVAKTKSFSSENIILHPKKQDQVLGKQDNRVILFGKKIGVNPESLSKSELIGIKDDDVQIIKASKLSPLQAGLLILAVKDLELNQRPVPYEEWKQICEASGIKSNTPLYQLAINAKQMGYIDKKKHESKEMLLNSKGQLFVKKALEKFLSIN